MGTRSGFESVIALVLAAGLVAGSVGCDDDATDERAGPYRITSIDAESEGDVEWGPDDDQVDRWVDEALADSDRGISAGRIGPGLRAAVYLETRLQDERRGERLVVDASARIEQPIVTPNAPMIGLQAHASTDHLFADGPPSPPQLHALSRTLGRGAVDDAVAELRERAFVERLEPVELAVQIADPGEETARRLLAIDYAVDEAGDEGVDEVVERGLVKALRTGDDEVVVNAAEALAELDVDGVEQLLLSEAQRLSRAEEYDVYLELVAVVAGLDDPAILLYLETVAEAHDAPHVRRRVRHLIEDRPPVADQLSAEES